MRTSVDLPDALFTKAKRLAQEKGTTLRELIVEGLQMVTARQARRPRFRLRDVSHGEGGLVDGLAESDWDTIRAIAYEGRGG